MLRRSALCESTGLWTFRLTIVVGGKDRCKTLMSTHGFWHERRRRWGGTCLPRDTMHYSKVTSRTRAVHACGLKIAPVFPTMIGRSAWPRAHIIVQEVRWGSDAVIHGAGSGYASILTLRTGRLHPPRSWTKNNDTFRMSMRSPLTIGSLAGR